MSDIEIGLLAKMIARTSKDKSWDYHDQNFRQVINFSKRPHVVLSQAVTLENTHCCAFWFVAMNGQPIVSIMEF